MTTENQAPEGALPPLPDARWAWRAGDRPYEDSYSRSQMQDYARAALAAQPQAAESPCACWPGRMCARSAQCAESVCGAPATEEGARTVTVDLAADEVLVALKRGEGYEDVHPELVSEDAIGDNWPEYRTIHGAALTAQPQRTPDGGLSLDELRRLWAAATPLRMPELPPHELGAREVAFARSIEAARPAPAEGDGRARPKLDASWIAAEDEAAGALVAPSPDLAYSTDEENFSKDFCDVLDELRNDFEDHELIGKPYWVGEKVEHPASHYFSRSAERIVEIAAELAYDENEHAEDFGTDATKEAIAELQAFIEAWADKHVKVNFWTVVNVRKLAVTEEDLT